MTYPIHPAAMLFPMMSEEELAGLVADIRENGQLEPILLYHGQILDGRNRYAACEKAGVEPKYVNANGSVVSPTSLVLSKNLHRRHLSISQRGAIAAESIPLFKAEAHERQMSGLKNQSHTSLAPIGANDKGRAADFVAEQLQVSPRTVQRAIEVQRNDPKAFERVKAGEITLNAANREEEKRTVRPKADTGIPQTKRQIDIAHSQKQRMISALSTIIGLCRGLGEALNLDHVLHVCEDEEKKAWANRARESANKLRKFAARLERGTDAECS